MSTPIFDHDTDIQVLHKNNKLELGNWIDHLNYLSLEMENLLLIAGQKSFNDPILLQKIEDKRRENSAQLDVYFQYANNLEGTKECQDMECDHFYLSQHEKYRRLYLYHLEKYRRVKDDIFKLIHVRLGLHTKKTV